MDDLLEVEEAKYISLYCSDYVREMIDSAAFHREKQQQAIKARKGLKSSIGGQFEQLGDHHGNVIRRSPIETSTLFLMESGHEHATRSHNIANHQQEFKVDQMGPQQTESSAMVLRHPPASPNYPLLYEDRTFWENDSKVAYDAEIKHKFPLGKLRQSLLKELGPSTFDQAYSKMVSLEQADDLVSKPKTNMSTTSTGTVSTAMSAQTKNTPLFVTKKLKGS